MIHQQSIDWGNFDIVHSNLNRVAEWWGKFSLRAAIQKERKRDPAGKPVHCCSCCFCDGRCWCFLYTWLYSFADTKVGPVWKMELSFAPVKHFTKRRVFQASPRRIVLVKNSEMNNISAKGFRDLEQMYSGFMRRWSNLPEQRTVLYPASRSESEKRSKIWMQN